MTLEDKVNLLFNFCKADVCIYYNQHKSSYMKIDEYIGHIDDEHCIDAEVLAEMIAQDKFIQVIFFPDTPIGSYSVYHYDLDKALDACIDILREEGKLNNQPPE